MINFAYYVLFVLSRGVHCLVGEVINLRLQERLSCILRHPFATCDDAKNDHDHDNEIPKAAAVVVVVARAAGT